VLGDRAMGGVYGIMCVLRVVLGVEMKFEEAIKQSKKDWESAIQTEQE